MHFLKTRGALATLPSPVADGYTKNLIIHSCNYEPMVVYTYMYVLIPVVSSTNLQDHTIITNC